MLVFVQNVAAVLLVSSLCMAELAKTLFANATSQQHAHYEAAYPLYGLNAFANHGDAFRRWKTDLYP